MLEAWRSRWGEKTGDMIYLLSTVVAILLLWQMVITFFSLPEFILPSPSLTVTTFFKFYRLLSIHALVTICETLAGLLFAIFFGVLVAISMVWSRFLERTILPLLVFFQTTPKLAIAPLFLVWFGFGYTPKVIIAFWLAYFPIAISTITGLRDIQPRMLDLIHSMSATTWQTFYKIRIPNALPYFFSGLKLGLISSLLGAIVGEFVGGDWGLGYLITMAQFNSDVKFLFAVVVLLSITGKVLFSMIEWVERLSIPWHVAVRREEEQFFAA